MVSARFERGVVVVAGLALAASGALLLPEAHDPSVGLIVAAAPPFVTGAIAAGLAARSAPRWRRALLAANDLVLLATATFYAFFGFLLMIVPGLVIVALAGGYVRIARRGDTEERSARTALATGGAWTILFGFYHLLTDDPGVLLALGGSLGLAFAGLAWLRAITRERAERTGPPRAVVN